MTYRLVCAFVGAATFGAACAPAKGDASGTGSENSGGDGDSGDGDATGDGDEVYLGTGANSGAGGNILAGAGGSAGDGDSVGSGGTSVGSGGTSEGPPQHGDGGAPAGVGGSTQGAGGAADGNGGSTSVTSCTPNDAGGFVAMGETVFDERTCLTWMRDNTTGDPYAEAVAYCDALVLGNYDDWRLPTAGEVTTIFKCDGMWPPIDDTVFNVMGDGIWTTTETGTIAGDLPKVCGAGQSSGSFYDFGQVGGQNTRCVRGTSDVPDRSDCTTNPAICP